MGSKRTKMIIALLASITGISSATAGGVVVAYEAMFPRFERPNYELVAGEYCYDRISDEISRTEFMYSVGDHSLKGYYYPSAESKGLVVISHGIKAGADDYIPIAKYMVGAGFDVFAYDGTGTYDSEGDDSVGMCQAIIDLEATLKYIEKDPSLSKKPVFLIGHSWGGYASTSVLSLSDNVKACASIASMDNGCTMMVEKAEEYVGKKIAAIPEPIFNAYQYLLFKDYTKCTAVKGINTRNIPVLIAHGIDDRTITFNTQAIIAHKDQFTNPNVQYYIGKGFQGTHTGIWHSVDAAAYEAEIESELKLMEMKKGEKLTDEEIAAFYKTIDHERYSAVNKELMDQIVKMFESTLK